MADLRREPDRAKAFRNVRNEYRIAVSLAEDAGHICGADVAAAFFTDIDTGNATYQVSGRDRTNQITDGGNNNKGEHEIKGSGQVLTGDMISEGVNDCKSFLINHIEIIETSAGVIPLTRAAWPKDVGRTLASF